MIKVIKKSGKVEEYDKIKMLTSISNCADDARIPLSHKDLDIIGVEIDKQLREIRKDGSNSSSYEIRAIIIDVLDKLGFKKAAESYFNGRLIMKPKSK